MFHKNPPITLESVGTIWNSTAMMGKFHQKKTKLFLPESRKEITDIRPTNSPVKFVIRSDDGWISIVAYDYKLDVVDNK